jgi:hypothetical protein
MYSARYFLSDLKKLEFSRHIFKNTQISNFMKICPVGAELLHADGRTDMTKLIAASRNFANAPVNGPKTGNRNINKTATLVLGSGYPSARCQEVTATHAIRHGVTTRIGHPGPSKSESCGRPKMDGMP